MSESLKIDMEAPMWKLIFERPDIVKAMLEMAEKFKDEKKPLK